MRKQIAKKRANTKSFFDNQLIFTKLESVNNPKSIHGIYPYRGKISAIDAQQIIKQFSKKGILLDPFCGSGTIIFEGQQHGLKVIGCDMNPLAVILSKGKVETKNLDKELSMARQLISESKNTKDTIKIPPIILDFFHKETAQQIMKTAKYFDRMSNYLKACFMGAICLAARGCNHYKWTSVTVGKKIKPFRNIDFYEKFFSKISKHYENTVNKGVVYEKDARNLSQFLDKESIDYVFSSPPYFDALDYTSYHAKFIYAALGWSRDKVRKNLIQNVKDYEENMKIVLKEIDYVTKKNAMIVFVVGDKKLSNGTIINGGEFFKKIAPFENFYIIERHYNGTSSKVIDDINRTKRKEQIIVWNKN